MLQPGDPAPPFELTTDEGKPISLRDFRGKSALLYFFVKALTPGWTTEASEFRDAKQKFDQFNAVILGCSADQPEMLAKFRAKHKINFPLISDPEFHAIEAYGARRMKTFLGKSFLGIVRSSILIGPDGKIVRMWDKVIAKGHADEVLAALAAFRKK